MEKRRHTLDVLFPLGLLAVYALAAAGAVLLAAGSYRSGLTRAHRDFGCTTALAYVAEKLRSGDEAGAVRVDALEDCPALVLSVNREGGWYDTYIYCYDGSLRELMVKRELTPTPKWERSCWSWRISARSGRGTGFCAWSANPRGRRLHVMLT